MKQEMTEHNHALPLWVSEPVRRYIAHTEGGLSIRALAREDGCHASTILRQIRQVENARDDQLVDEALAVLGRCGTRDTVSKFETSGRDMPGFSPDEAQAMPADLEKEAVPVLRRLAQPGAVLAVAQNMDRAVIVRDTPDGTTHRLGVVERRIARALALNQWISCANPGAVSQYRLTVSGRNALKDLIASAENRAFGFAEGPAAFRRAKEEKRNAQRQRIGILDAPVLALSRRRDRDGSPFLSGDLVRAAQRIQDDFELAHMEPRVTTNWDDYLTAGTSGPGGTGDRPLRGAAAARERVSAALTALGPGLGDVVLECCCRMQGLETAEKKLGWSARSGKIVLRIALQRLRQHYDGLNDGGGLIG